MTQKKNVPVYLANAMKECGYSQKQVGEAFNTSQSTISRRFNETKK
jgi:transcriptional regulator with XRE-family HTH domain